MGRARADATVLMDSRAPVTVAIARFDDLLALGMRFLLKDHPSVSVVARRHRLRPPVGGAENAPSRVLILESASSIT